MRFGRKPKGEELELEAQGGTSSADMSLPQVREWLLEDLLPQVAALEARDELSQYVRPIMQAVVSAIAGRWSDEKRGAEEPRFERAKEILETARPRPE